MLLTQERAMLLSEIMTKTGYDEDAPLHSNLIPSSAYLEGIIGELEIIYGFDGPGKYWAIANVEYNDRVISFDHKRHDFPSKYDALLSAIEEVAAKIVDEMFPVETSPMKAGVDKELINKTLTDKQKQLRAEKRYDEIKLTKDQKEILGEENSCWVEAPAFYKNSMWTN